MTMILQTIFDSKRRRVETAKASVDAKRLAETGRLAAAGRQPHRLRRAVNESAGMNIIAEFKRASPSKGVINSTADPAAIARAYQTGGACAISVLTEQDHFQGSLADLVSVRSAVDLPILQKDFVFDEFQIYEAAAAGADAVLLIVAMLADEDLRRLRGLAEDDLGLDALVEVHSADELQRAVAAGGTLIGVNNRDLRTFAVSLDVSREVIRHAPDNAVMISESGLKTREELIELRGLGYSGFLIGETLMRGGNAQSELMNPAAEGLPE